MNYRGVLTAVVLLILAGCTVEEPASPAATRGASALPVLADNLDADAFKAALVGEWVSVFTGPSGRYVRRLVMDATGGATVTLAGEEAAPVVAGPYTVTFSRPLSEQCVTLGRIESRDPSASEPLVLSRVNFGRHNGTLFIEPFGTPLPFDPASNRLLLRIDRPPHGVLMRVARQRRDPGIKTPHPNISRGPEG